MSELNLKARLEQLHTKTVEQLLQRIESGEATAAEFTAAINLLKHNGIECRPGSDENLAAIRDRVFRFASPPADDAPLA